MQTKKKRKLMPKQMRMPKKRTPELEVNLAVRKTQITNQLLLSRRMRKMKNLQLILLLCPSIGCKLSENLALFMSYNIKR
jgi:hypothetical protein